MIAVITFQVITNYILICAKWLYSCARLGDILDPEPKTSAKALSTSDSDLENDDDSQLTRRRILVRRFQSLFGEEPTVCVRAPGRAE